MHEKMQLNDFKDDFIIISAESKNHNLKKNKKERSNIE